MSQPASDWFSYQIWLYTSRHKSNMGTDHPDEVIRLGTDEGIHTVTTLYKMYQEEVQPFICKSCKETKPLKGSLQKCDSFIPCTCYNICLDCLTNKRCMQRRAGQIRCTQAMVDLGQRLATL
jgi:hypothetical protein